MNVDNAMLIAISEARHSCKGAKSLKEKIIKAMKTTWHHWMLTNEDKQLEAAITAAYLESSGQDKLIVKENMIFLNKLASGNINDISVPKKILPLLGMWREQIK